MMIHVSVTQEGPTEVKKYDRINSMTLLKWNIMSQAERWSFYLIWIIVVVRLANLQCVQVIHTLDTVSFSVLL